MRHENVIRQLSLEQKCALLSGKTVWQTRDYPALGIPSIWLSDGPNGLRKQAGAADHLGLNGSEPATCFPTAATVANSWDPELCGQIGEALGAEAAAQGVNVVLGPGLNIKRSPLCGRSFEYFSEDPYLAGKLAAGYVRGIQKNGTAACPKHFAVNSQELRRMSSDSVLDERTLRELYLTAFEIVVREARPKAVMSSYNGVNGVYANENEHLLRDILRDEWGFDGAVVTDWGGSNDHAAGVKAGSTLEMPAPGLGSVRELLSAVEAGTVTEADVDARVDELLELVFSTARAVEQAPKSCDIEAHHALARHAAAQSVVLLKNEGGLLPLAAGARAAVIGDFAQEPRYQGAGSSMVNPTRLDTLSRAAEEAGISCVGFAPGYRRDGKADEAMQKDAVELARRADVVLFCLGLAENSESEGLDRRHILLAENQKRTLEAVAAANPNVVAIVSAGSPIEMGWTERCRAVAHGYLGGQAGAAAMADILTGRVNPCGKLAETLPVRCEDTPAYRRFPEGQRSAEYREGLYVGYRYYDTAGVPVAYPFGFGLSYTSFAYSGLSVSEKEAVFTITNTGKTPGAEIAQLYIGKKDGQIFRPAKELKGFAKVFLNAGESRQVTIPLDDKAFRYFNVKTNRWETEGGVYQIYVGASSADLRLTGETAVEGTGAPDPYQGLELPSYRSGKIQNVPDGEFAALLGRPIPAQPKGFDRNSTFSDLRHGRSPIGWLVWLVLHTMYERSIRAGRPNLNVLFIYNMPMRGLAKLTGGSVSMEMVDGIVMEARGFWIIGLLRVLAGAIQNAVKNRRLKKAIEG